MKIRLNEIPQEGRNYTFNRETGELNSKLEDLVQDHAYDVELFIKPIGSAYEMRGRVKTSVTDVCSLCGYDLELPIDRKVNEILMEDTEEYRKAHSVHGNQSVDYEGEGPSMVSYKGNVFDAGEFVHEAIALAQPFYPSCGDQKCEHLEEIRRIESELAEAYEKADEAPQGHPGFAALKGLDLGSSGSKKQ